MSGGAGEAKQLNCSLVTRLERCGPIRRFGTIPGNEDTFAALSTRTVIQIKPALISHDLPFPPVIRTPPRMV